MRSVPVLTLALAAAVHAAPAVAGCGPADADFTAPLEWAAVPVSVDLADERVLLGLHGERVPSRRAPVWLAEAGDPLPQTWMDKVDWSAYRLDAGAPAPTRLYFDADGRLCRAERYDLGQGGRRASPPFLLGGFALEYDAAGALRRAVEFDQTAYRAPPVYSAVRQACLKRDAQGVLEAFVGGGCGDAGKTAAARRYVRDASGRLLRVIDGSEQGTAMSVQTYDAEGRPLRRYVGPEAARGHSPQGDGPYPYAAPPPQSDPVYVLERGRLSRLSSEEPDTDWRIVRIADDVPLDGGEDESWDPAAQTVLAQGAADAQGRASLSSEAQERVWKAMLDAPGRIFWYRNPMSRVQLVPAMPQARWRACADPSNLAADACG